MFLLSSESGWIVHTPAKINLALEVLGRRLDGYHEVETLLVPVRLFDTLRFEPTGDPLSLSLPSRAPSFSSAIPTDRRNLALQALHRLAEVSGHLPTGRLTLEKRIPIEAGLGGGSSDAAAALALANRAWGIGYPRSKLMEIARDIGTDVPFFLHGGAAIAKGRGERLEPASLPAGLPLVIVKPPLGLSTPKVFQKLAMRAGDTLSPSSNRCRNLATALQNGVTFQKWSPWVRNCLQLPAQQLTDWVERIALALAGLPVVAHQMTGSGSGYFALCRNWRAAQQVAARLRGQPWQLVVATCSCR